MYFVYVLKNGRTKEIYYGFTNNLDRRLLEHSKDKEGFDLVYYEAYISEGDARKREKRLKNYAQALTALKTRISESLR